MFTKLFKFFVYINLICSTLCFDIPKVLETNGIVPDIINDSPNDKLSVVYSGKVFEIGEELTPLEVQQQPNVSWSADPNKFYFLAMIDPDVPSRKEPILGQIQHWSVGNIRGNDVKTGDVLAAYRGAGPLKHTGLHRYIFLVFQQPGRLEFIEKFIPKDTIVGRTKFSIKQFVDKYQLGKPLFVNYFEAQWTE